MQRARSVRLLPGCVSPPCAVWVVEGLPVARRLHLEAREPRSHRVKEVGQEVDGAGHAWRREVENATETQERFQYDILESFQFS